MTKSEKSTKEKVNTKREANIGYWGIAWKQFKRSKLGMGSLSLLVAFCLAGIYAPFLASSKPLFVIYQEEPYFPLFRYLFYTRFYTKNLDIFFNLLMFTLPLLFIACKWRVKGFMALGACQLLFFIALTTRQPSDPTVDISLANEKRQAMQAASPWTWQQELSYMNDYARLNLVLQNVLRKQQQQQLLSFMSSQGNNISYASLWRMENEQENATIESLQKRIGASPTAEGTAAKERIQYMQDRRQWIEEQALQVHWLILPLIRPFHWEDDAGGEQKLNQILPWWKLTRINQKDLAAALIFGIRISMMVGILSVGLALIIGIPVGAMAGYYGGTLDMIVSRLLEVWEAMPTFFMLLMIVAITQSKSVFLVILVIGLFGWTGFSRYVRGEAFKQRNLPYVEAARAIGFSNRQIIFSQILPNAISPVLTLLPFAIMGAITSEAGLSFLGLGEEGSSSWGVLMDEGRSAFPGESYLLWPPAILLTLLLVAIALVGDALRDALDPKMH